MSQFKYTLPSGAKFTMEAPVGTTQAQADYIFYSQVAAGALVGFKPGQSVTSTTSSIAKFTLSRLDRGTAGVDDTVILAIVNGLPTINNLPAVNGIPSLINTPLVNPITQANIAQITNTGFTAPAIGTLSSNQTQALMAQVANNVDQSPDVITPTKGVGRYGLSCQQLEMAGYIKPGTWEQFIKNGPSTEEEVLAVSGVWTGLHGIYSLSDFLRNRNAQNNAQATLMSNGYNSLQAAGVIKTPAAQTINDVVGTVYTGSNVALTTATASITNQTNGQVASLVTNASQYGTALTAQWASDLPPVTNVTSNLTSVQGNSPAVNIFGALGAGLAVSNLGIESVKTAMDVLGKASQFASTASSSFSGLSNISLSGIGDKLSNISLSGLGDKLSASAGALAGQIEGQIAGQAKALVGQAQAQANALIAQAQGQINSLISMGDSLVAGVQKAAGYTNTVSRAPVDTAVTKIIGSSKISPPTFGSGTDSVGAALDISKAQSVLSGLGGVSQSQATSLITLS
jgi:hypothetical protein